MSRRLLAVVMATCLGVLVNTTAHHTSRSARTVNQGNMQEELTDQWAEDEYVLAEASGNDAKPF